MDVNVRIAGAGDVAALAGLRRRWNEEHSGAAIDDPRFGDVFARWWDAERGSRTFFLAELSGEAVGMVNVKHYDRMPVAGGDGGRWGYVGNLFVLPERRGARIGQVLMEEVQRWALAEGLAHLRLAPSPLAHPFYARLGYRPGAVVELDPPFQP